MNSRLLFCCMVASLSFISCSSDPSFGISNKTGKVLDSLYMQPGDSTQKKYISLQPNETQNYRVDMSREKFDGAYMISFKHNGSWKNTAFGYYSNGAALESFTKVDILPDTILITYVK